MLTKSGPKLLDFGLAKTQPAAASFSSQSAAPTVAATLTGQGTIVGTLCAAMVLGIFDVAGKYYVPWAGAFVIYALMVALLLLFPRGLLRRIR